MKSVPIFLSMTGVLFLIACSAADIGTPQQNSSGACGEETVQDYNNVAVTCALANSPTLAEDCVKTADAFQSKYPGINCQAERVKGSSSVQINRSSVDALSAKARETKASVCTRDVELAFMRADNDCALVDTEFATALSSSKCLSSVDAFNQLSPNANCASQPPLHNGQITLERVYTFSRGAKGNAEFREGRDCSSSIQQRLNSVLFTCSYQHSACGGKVDTFIADWPAISCSAKSSDGAKVQVTEAYLLGLKR